MKAIIDIAPAGSGMKTARAQLRASRTGKKADYYLHYETARLLFSDLTPSRLELLHTLRRLGPTTVYALAKEAGRNYSNVHTDIGVLEGLDLVARTAKDQVWVPFEAIQINLAFPAATAA